MPAILIYALLAIPLIGAYAMFALGISAIYRASRVLNLAHGAMAMIPAYIMYSLTRLGVPVGIGLVIAVLSGAILGMTVERFFVRRLRSQGPTAQTVGTIAVTGLLVALAGKLWGTTPLLAPQIFPKGAIHIDVSGIRYGELGLFVTAVGVCFLVFTFFVRTDYGLAMRGAAQNRTAAGLMGINPDMAAAAAWALGGGIAGLAGVMLASVTNLDPYTLSLQVLPAFVAALIGGLESLTGALWGAAIAGLAFGLVPYLAGTPVIGNVMRLSGAPQLGLTILVLAVMALRGRRYAGSDSSDAGLSTSTPAMRPISGARMGWFMLSSVVVAAVWPLIVPYSVLGASLVWIELAVVAVSLVVLTGWVGQISLAQASFVGIAALATGLISRGWGLGFPVSTILGAALAGLIAAGLGVVALRVRGLYLAVATLIFAWMCDAFLFKTPWLGASSGTSTITAQRLGKPGGIPFIDLTSRQTLFYVFSAVLALIVFAVMNLRKTKIGRAFYAVRGSETAAASLGIDVVRYKLLAFAASGVIAGVAGNLLMVSERAVVPGQFLFTQSLQYLAIAVVGGLGSLGGALASAAIFAGLDVLFFRVSFLSGWLEVVSAILLAAVLLLYPGGLAAIPAGIRRASRGFASRRTAAMRMLTRLLFASRPAAGRRPATLAGVGSKMAAARRAVAGSARILSRGLDGTAKPIIRAAKRKRASVTQPTYDWFAAATGGEMAEIERVSAPSNNGHNGHHSLEKLSLAALELKAPISTPDRTVLEANEITVRFGGLTAVNHASLSVPEGQIVGLIGPNGAGKTTLFNSILGLNQPSNGRISIFGVDATALPPHLRARLGVGRTFQVIQLFGELTVFENLLVATHLRNPSGFLSNVAVTTHTLKAEAAARARVHQILSLLSLESYADSSVRGLPFGVLRMIELGRTLVTGSPLIMLDEPASGLNETETDQLSSVIKQLKRLGISVLLIEHDVRMVVDICDYMYVLDQGQIIAAGIPADVQRDQRVIEAYLGSAEESVRV